MGGQESDARGSWARLVSRAPRVRLSLPAAALRTEARALTEEPGGAVWCEERVWQAEDGAWLFARGIRREGSEQEELLLVPAATPEGLVAALRARVGMTPGLVEVLGRAGIEIGLEPDDQPED